MELQSVLKGELGPVLSKCIEEGFSEGSLSRLSTYETVLLKNAIFVLHQADSVSVMRDEKVGDLLSADPGDWEHEIDNLEIFAENS